MPGQVQEPQVPGTPGGYPDSGTVTSWAVRSGGSSHGIRGKIVARTGMGSRGHCEERYVPCPHDPRNLWQIFNGIEQNEKMKCRSVAGTARIFRAGGQFLRLKFK
jgi:hypothetical protein